MLKRLVRDLITHPRVASTVGALASGMVPILMLHRIADPERGNAGDSALLLRRALAYLRRERFTILPLGTLLEHLADPACRPAALRRTVAVTIDDGYADAASVGMPAFAEFDCPVTVFVTSGPVDRECWFWWDRIEYAVRASRRRTLHLEIRDAPWTAAWQDEAQLVQVLVRLWADVKFLPIAVRDATIDAVAAQLEVELPAAPPPRYASMTWDEIRSCGQSGLMTFGPHTVTHPILSLTDDAQSAWEIRHSWARLRAECEATVPVFCYPDGSPSSYGLRELDVIARDGFLGAVTTEQRYATPGDFAPEWPRARFAVPRFPYLEEPSGFRQVVHGLEHVKTWLRPPSRAIYPGARVGA